MTTSIIIVNITHQGRSADYEVPTTSDLQDADIKRTGAELLGVPPDTFTNYVVDHMGDRVYLRPKVEVRNPNIAPPMLPMAWPTT